MAGDTDGRAGAAGAAAVGAVLRDAREVRGASLADCAAALRARTEQLRALEDGHLGVFGGDVYARGFVRSYARLLGVDPAPLLDELGAGDGGIGHLRTLPTERIRPDRRTPARLIALAVGVVAVVVVAAALRLGDVRTPDAAPPPSTAATDAPADGPAVAPTPDPVPAPAVVAPVVPVDLVLTLEAASWLEVVVDGVVVEPGRTAPAGETLRYEGRLAVVVRYGNAGGVRAELNGDDLGPQGTPGQVLRVGYGPDGVLDAPSAADPAG